MDERFNFHGKALSGIPELRPRWQRGMDFTSAALGDAVGKVYVERYFPAETKAKVQAMVGDLVKAFGKRIDALAWMSPETKAKAKQKLETLKVGVGYPDQWQDYAGLEIVKGDALGNAQRAELVRIPPPARQTAPAGRSRRMVDDAADGECGQSSAAERAEFSGRDHSAAVFRCECRRRAQLRLDGRDHRPRDQPQLRRPGQPVRCRGPAGQLVDEGRLRTLQGRRRGAGRAVRRAIGRFPIWR